MGIVRVEGRVHYMLSQPNTLEAHDHPLLELKLSAAGCIAAGSLVRETLSVAGREMKIPVLLEGEMAFGKGTFGQLHSVSGR
jgi:hypothetical protein